MGKSKRSQESAGQHAKPSVKVSTKILSQPSEENLVPTDREKGLL